MGPEIRVMLSVRSATAYPTQATADTFPIRYEGCRNAFAANPMNTGRVLVILGTALVAAGLAWPWISRLGLGRLPGDIAIQRPGFSFYFPVVSCAVVSVVLTLLFWLFRK